MRKYADSPGRGAHEEGPPPGNTGDPGNSRGEVKFLGSQDGDGRVGNAPLEGREQYDDSFLDGYGPDSPVTKPTLPRRWMVGAPGVARALVEMRNGDGMASVEADFGRGCAYRFEAVFLDQGQGVQFLCPVGALN